MEPLPSHFVSDPKLPLDCTVPEFTDATDRSCWYLFNTANRGSRVDFQPNNEVITPMWKRYICSRNSVASVVGASNFDNDGFGGQSQPDGPASFCRPQERVVASGNQCHSASKRDYEQLTLWENSKLATVPSKRRSHRGRYSQSPDTAAQALLQDVQTRQVNEYNRRGNTHLNHSREYPGVHLRHQPLEDFKNDIRQNQHASFATENMFLEWMCGSPERTRERMILPRADFQWDSDPRFELPRVYTPGLNDETLQTMQQAQLKYLDCLEVSIDFVNVCSGGSIRDVKLHNQGPIRRTENARFPTLPQENRGKSKQERSTNKQDNGGAKPLRSSNKDEIVGLKEGSSQLDEELRGGRPRPNSHGAKPGRKRCTQQQKRAKHIRGEQRRRNLVRERFDTLSQLVPGLQGKRFSRRTTLAIACDWLEELLRDNKALVVQAAALSETQ